MKLVNIVYNKDVNSRQYTYAAGNDVNVGDVRFAIARGKTLEALVVSEIPADEILNTLNTLTYPITAMQVIGNLVPVEEEVDGEVQV